MYDFWLQPETTVQTTDRRSDRDEGRVTKPSYLRVYKHLQDRNDSNKTVKEIKMMKTGKSKFYVTAQRKEYTKPLRELHKTFISTTNITITFSSFIKYKPFYFGVLTEREKESCVCSKCKNAHLNLRGINSYRRMENNTDSLLCNRISKRTGIIRSYRFGPNIS